MSTAVTVLSVIAVVAFSVAAFGGVRRALAANHRPTAIAATSFAVAMALYAFVSVSNALEAANITHALNAYEDYAEILFTPLIMFTLVMAQTAVETVRRSQSEHMMTRQNELLMSIVDAAPSGIMIVAPGGHITFANDAAHDMLGLAEDPDTGQYSAPGWTLHDADGNISSLSDLARASASSVPQTIDWPDGTRSELLFTVTPMSDATHTLGGALVAIERTGARS